MENRGTLIVPFADFDFYMDEISDVFTLLSYEVLDGGVFIHAFGRSEEFLEDSLNEIIYLETDDEDESNYYFEAVKDFE